MKNKHLLFALCSLPFASMVRAADFPSASNPQPLSKYGNIPNVQNYSSNPFWSPDSPYNQRMPVPVYVQGAELNTAECRSVAAQVVAYQCSINDNCNGKKVSDIKPGAMVLLSQMQGHNYVSACGGYIDAAFNDYVAQYGVIQGGAGFPNAVIPGSNPQPNDFKIENPYKIQLPYDQNGEWYREQLEREAELGRLQNQNGGGNVRLAHADMPTTIADLSFTERMANAAAGYEQWRCNPETGENCAYQTLNIESDEKFADRCRNYPDLAGCEAFRKPEPVVPPVADASTGTKEVVKVTLYGMIRK